jgi:hypothetical protein
MSSSVVYKQKHALIIGINNYHREPLNYCVNDATDLGKTLRSIGFNVSLKTKCNRNEFYGITDTFTTSIQPDDLALFYFAGHGKQKNCENYLFPSDYDYDYIADEHSYIVHHAINVKYIMQKISDSKCRVAIYLFDCCRNLVRTRAINVDQGLILMSAPERALIVYACAPGKAVLDETRNNRNGSFMENLLEHITTSNKDIEVIMQDVAHAVNLQTRGFQSPRRISSLMEKVFLVVDPKSIDASRRKNPENSSQKPWPTARPATTTNNSIYKKYFEGDDDDADEEGNASKESKPMTDRPSTLAQKTGKPTFLKKTLKTANDLKPDDQSAKDLPNKTNKSDNGQQSSSTIQTYSPPPATIDKIEHDTHSIKDTVIDPQRRRDLLVFVQSLQVRYELHIPVDSTIKQLKNIIWQKINVNVERCQEQFYTLLLFTHRMHIFLSEEAELVNEFMKLTPSEPHFYFYALKRPQQSDEMYTYETKTSNLFSINTDWWNPVYFMGDAQLPRPQSVLLSSLYALRLFFYK